MFQRSIEQQIALNQSRTPSERFQSLCDLLDFARAIAPTGAEAQQRRRRVASARQLEKEQWRVRCRQFLAAQRRESDEDAEIAQDEADIKDLLAAYHGRIDADYVRAEFATVADANDPRWEKLEGWLKEPRDE